MYGLWSEDKIFQSTKTAMSVPADVMKEELSNVNTAHFKVMYKEKEFMEEMLKAKNMLAERRILIILSLGIRSILAEPVFGRPWSRTQRL